MNISPLTIYLWQLADKLIAASAALTVAAGIAAFFAAIFSTYPDENLAAFAKSKIKVAVVSFVTLFAVGTLLPSSKTIAMMVVIPEIAHSKIVQQDLPDIYNAAVKALKDQLAK